jgi:hypothetical protein
VGAALAGRWITEVPGATIDVLLDVAAALVALPVEPEAIHVIEWPRGPIQRATRFG